MNVHHTLPIRYNFLSSRSVKHMIRRVFFAKFILSFYRGRLHVIMTVLRLDTIQISAATSRVRIFNMLMANSATGFVLLNNSLTMNIMTVNTYYAYEGYHISGSTGNIPLMADSDTVFIAPNGPPPRCIMKVIPLATV